MTNLKIIARLRASTFTDEDGGTYTRAFQPGLTEEALEERRKRFSTHHLADESREILRVTRGSNETFLENAPRARCSV